MCFYREDGLPVISREVVSLVQLLLQTVQYVVLELMLHRYMKLSFSFELIKVKTYDGVENELHKIIIAFIFSMLVF